MKFGSQFFIKQLIVKKQSMARHNVDQYFTNFSSQVFSRKLAMAPFGGTKILSGSSFLILM